jgi:hypothetical protein
VCRVSVAAVARRYVPFNLFGNFHPVLTALYVLIQVPKLGKALKQGFPESFPAADLAWGQFAKLASPSI